MSSAAEPTTNASRSRWSTLTNRSQVPLRDPRVRARSSAGTGCARDNRACSATIASASSGRIGRRWTAPPSASRTSASQCGGLAARRLATSVSHAGRAGPGRAAGRPPSGWPGWPGRPRRLVPGSHGSTGRRHAVGHGRSARGSRPGGAAAASSRQSRRRRGAPGSSGSPVATREQVRPGPRHHLDQRVPAAAGGHPAAVAELVGQVPQRQVGGPLAVDGQLQVGERIQSVGVRAALGEQQLRPERPQQRRARRRGTRAASPRRRCPAAARR